MSLKTVTQGKSALPPRIVLYAVEGIGKSSFGASSLNPIFIQTEDGLGEIDAPRFPKPETFDEVIAQLKTLYDEKHGYKTVVVDTIDWLEPLIWGHVCTLQGKTNIEDIGYGKGYTFALDQWARFFTALDRLRAERNMAVLLIGHAEVKRFDSPETEPYERYQLKLHKITSAKVMEWADAVLFANYRVFVEKTDVGFNKKVVRGTGGDGRVMYTEERPAFKAKNRFGLPPELPFTKGEAWNALVTAIKNSRQTNKGE